MRIIVAENYEAMSRQAANILSSVVVMKPDCVLGLATGSTPIGTYQELIKRYQDGDLDFSRVKTVNLDEYVGLEPTHDQSYRYFMQTQLFDHVNINVENTNVPGGLAEDIEAECRRYDEVIASMGGIDIQVLGMGHNGHIGFNEPAEEFPKGTHQVDLAESTIEANARFFENRDMVPRKAVTMGIGSIMQARQILVVVSGEGKADIVEKAFRGPITPQVPASILQLHPDVILVGDKAALSKLL
ncbi:MAG: glucosamine-6-phosphate deaminase [Oscillospiraceae bacterium]|nr:glucosamine-6-phosphate deaminase [Oscillospiraceae bacterium]